MTKARKAVLAILEQSAEPLSATEVASMVGDRCDPVTIYRTLHYLEEHSLANSFILHCNEHGTERYYSAMDEEGSCHHHWFHCEQCHRFLDLGGCSLQPLLFAYEKENGIIIKDHTFFLTGICPDCRKNLLDTKA